MDPGDRRGEKYRIWWVCAGLAFTSGAALVYEIALTRVFAVAQGYHFGFLAISLALLGFGASGTVLALGSSSERRAPPSAGLLGNVGTLLPLVVLASYLAANYIPFDAYRVAWDPVQLAYLAGYLLALASPFLLAGLLQGLPLLLWPSQTASLYGANLIGSSLGCLVAVAALNWADSQGTVLVAALVAAAGALCFILAFVPRRRALLPAAELIVLAGLFWLSPPLLQIRLSPYGTLSQILNYPDARITARYWNAFSRVDVVSSSNIRSAPGLSLSYGGPIPRQSGMVVDADKVLALTSSQNLSPDFLANLPTAVAYGLRPNARVLILDPGGGLEVWNALAHGAQSIKGVEENPLVSGLTSAQFVSGADDSGAASGVQFISASPRSYSAGSLEQFDIVELGLSGNFRAVGAGAFALSEDYTLTIEGLRSYLEHLAPNGILVVQRWLQLPPSEETRAAALVIEALRSSGLREPGRDVIAIRSFSTMLILAKLEPFSPGEIDTIKTFARERQFDLVYYPGIQISEANRYNILQQDVYLESFQALLSNAPQFYRRSTYEVTPPTDDHPFFFHFFKWEQFPVVIALLGKTWQPFGGSGYLILLLLFALAFIVSVALLILPIWALGRKSRPIDSRTLVRVLVYFAALGCGFLFVEIPLIERFTLLLDYPVYAFTVVLFSLLLFSGIGSLFAERIPWRAALVSLVLAIALYAALVQVIPLLLGQTLFVRIVTAIIVVAPVGLLLGIPFPRGLVFVREEAPQLLPLAWGVNGFTSVLSSILATLLALSWGLTPILLGAGVAYALALASVFKMAGKAP